jgi:hypothetical protein
VIFNGSVRQIVRLMLMVVVNMSCLWVEEVLDVEVEVLVVVVVVVIVDNLQVDWVVLVVVMVMVMRWNIVEWVEKCVYINRIVLFVVVVEHFILVVVIGDVVRVWAY